ncbi:MAG: hypothetical protein ACE5GS_00895 [Kiloniellaceae bacterium]
MIFPESQRPAVPQAAAPAMFFNASSMSALVISQSLSKSATIPRMKAS